jgi:hypothetical protein
MDAEPSDKLYATVLRMVIWDERKETVMQVIENNGFTGDAGRKIYQKARNERIATIRADCFRKVLNGLLWIVPAVVISCVTWYWFRGIAERYFLIAPGLLLVGLWRVFDGLLGMLLAPGKKGSVAE